MEFKLNGFTYKFKTICIDDKQPRILKFVPSRRYTKWRHMTVRHCNGFVYFKSKGKDYKINLETHDLYQGKNFIENIYKCHAEDCNGGRGFNIRGKLFCSPRCGNSHWGLTAGDDDYWSEEEEIVLKGSSI